MKRGLCLSLAVLALFAAPAARAQVPPSAAEYASYEGLHAASAKGDIAAIRRLAADKNRLNARDSYGRTPLMVAAYARQYESAAALMAAGADVDALERDRYDVVTIASVANDPKMLKLVLAGGAKPGQTTSPYDGTALIAAGAPLDHVNNLNWTALIESIVLGDGGPDHIACLKALIDAGADVNIADGNGVSPLRLAERNGYDEMVRLLKAAGAK